jgi:uncharacterized membrane protein (UPF0136 family)
MINSIDVFVKNNNTLSIVLGFVAATIGIALGFFMKLEIVNVVAGLLSSLGLIFAFFAIAVRKKIRS